MKNIQLLPIIFLFLFQTACGAQETKQLSLITPFAFNSQPTHSELFDFITKFEGSRLTVYSDNGKWAVGYGHRLLPNELNKSGSPLKENYSIKEIVSLFNSDLDVAMAGVKSQYTTFNQQPKLIQLILIDLNWNIGKEGMSKFVLFNKAIEEMNYAEAAKELKDSDYYRDDKLGRRAKEHYAVIISWFTNEKLQ